MCLPGEFFPHMLKDVPGSQRFQLVQRRLDRSTCRSCAARVSTTPRWPTSAARSAKVLGDSVDLHCHFVDDIPLTPSGKLRVTVSELPAAPIA